MSSDPDLPSETEAYYEIIASQEEVYLEQAEEDLRAILIFENPSLSRKQFEISRSESIHDPGTAGSLEEQLNHAAEELITGDADDPPIHEETVVEMLSVTWKTRRPDRFNDA